MTLPRVILALGLTALGLTAASLGHPTAAFFIGFLAFLAIMECLN